MKLTSDHDSGHLAALPFGGYLLFPDEREVILLDGTPLALLTEKETAVLLCLFLADGRRVSREEVLRSVWKEDIGARTRTVPTYIYRLRRKLEPHLDSPRLLLTDGTGYLLLRAGRPSDLASAGRRRRAPSNASRAALRPRP